MVVSIVTTEYKVERVQVNQGSSSNKLGLAESELEECLGTLIIINAQTSHNIIMGCLALNRLHVIVSTAHLRMKYPISDQVSIVQVNQQVARWCYEDSLHIRDSRRDPRLDQEDIRPSPGKDLKEVQIVYLMRIETTKNTLIKEQLIQILTKNRDVFTWSPKEMPEIDLDFLCHRLSTTPGMQPVCQKKRRLGEEKRRAVGEEIAKLLQAQFIRRTDLNKAIPKDLYSLPSIDSLVDGVSRCRVLSFTDAYLGYN
ncbi:hypothetical protein CR513_47408, partial [Mucuna pruriens]